MMAMNEKIWDLFFDNLQKILFPEIWLIIDSDISKMELTALLLLWKTDEIIMTQLADSINIPLSTATGVVSRLAKKGYVERLVDEANRRIVTVKLTQKGKDTVESVKQTVLKYWDILTGIFTGEEVDMIFGIIAKVIAVLSKKSSDEAGGGEKQVKKIHID